MSMDALLRLLGVIAFVGLPALGFWLQSQTHLLRGSNSSTGAMIGFLLVGIISGALIRSWWFLGGIATLFGVYAAAILVGPLTPSPDDTPIMVVFLVAVLAFVPLFAGAIAGTALGLAAERHAGRQRAH